MSHHTAYQLECTRCQRVAGFHAKAGLVQAYIHGVSRRSLSPQGLRHALTPKEHGAIAWASAIANCIRQEMALHARCGVCSILMGPGHTESGIGAFCGTHSGSVASRP